jgi:hypothetical protein
VSDVTMTEAEIALKVVPCPRCGAAPGETCAGRMRHQAAAAGDRTAVAELLEIERGAPLLAHPERLREADQLIKSAEAYGLVRRVSAGRPA